MDDNLIIINKVIEEKFDEASRDTKFINEIKKLLTKAGKFLNECIEYIQIEKDVGSKSSQYTEYYDFTNDSSNNLNNLIKNQKITATRSYAYLTKYKRQYHIANFNLKQNSEKSFIKAFLTLNEIREKLVGTSYISLIYKDENNTDIAPNKNVRVPLSELVKAGAVEKTGKD